MKSAIHHNGEQHIQHREHPVLHLSAQNSLDLEHTRGKIQRHCHEEPDINPVRYQELRQHRRKAEQGETEQLGKNEMLAREPVHQQIRRREHEKPQEPRDVTAEDRHENDRCRNDLADENDEGPLVPFLPEPFRESLFRVDQQAESKKKRENEPGKTMADTDTDEESDDQNAPRAVFFEEISFGFSSHAGSIPSERGKVYEGDHK